MVSVSSVSTSLYISVIRTTRARNTSIYGELDILDMGTERRGHKGLCTARSFIRWVGATIVHCLRLMALLRCPKSPFRQVKLTKPLILQYPAKILLSIWSLRCYASRRRDTARTMWKLQ